MSRHRYAQLVDTLTYYDHFMVTADFDAYCAAQSASRTCGGTGKRGGARPS